MAGLVPAIHAAQHPQMSQCMSTHHDDADIHGIGGDRGGALTRTVAALFLLTTSERLGVDGRHKASHDGLWRSVAPLGHAAVRGSRKSCGSHPHPASNVLIPNNCAHPRTSFIIKIANANMRRPRSREASG